MCLSPGRQIMCCARSTDHLFDPQSGQNKGNKIGICCFSTKQAALRSKEKEQRLIGLESGVEQHVHNGQYQSLHEIRPNPIF